MSTKETRRESYFEILPKVETRKKLIIELLEKKPMTAHEITETLVEKELIPYYDRNFVSPRLTELKDAGKVEVSGKAYSPRTDRNVAVWKLKEA